MEQLENSLFLDQVPSIWASRAYPSLLGLSTWFTDLVMRLRELEAWSSDFVLPICVWLAGGVTEFKLNSSENYFNICRLLQSAVFAYSDHAVDCETLRIAFG